jgi:hypothetical protein
MAELHRQDAVVISSDTFITSNFFIIKVARDFSQYVGSSHSMLVMAV